MLKCTLVVSQSRAHTLLPLGDIIYKPNPIRSCCIIGYDFKYDLPAVSLFKLHIQYGNPENPVELMPVVAVEKPQTVQGPALAGLF